MQIRTGSYHSTEFCIRLLGRFIEIGYGKRYVQIRW
jgi:hypothetical protein